MKSLTFHIVSLFCALGLFCAVGALTPSALAQKPGIAVSQSKADVRVPEGYWDARKANDTSVYSASNPFVSSVYGDRSSTEGGSVPKGVELDDVNSFVKESDGKSGFGGGAYLEDSDNSEAYDEKLDRPTFDELLELIYASLEQYSILFSGYPQTAGWTDETLKTIDDVIRQLENDPQNIKPVLARYAALVERAEMYKQKMTKDSEGADLIGQNKWDDDTVPVLVSRYSLTQRLELLDEFQRALERRAKLWERAAEYLALERAGGLNKPSQVPVQRLVELLQETQNVQSFFGDTANGRSWRASFDVDALATDLQSLLNLPVNRFEPTSRAQLGSSVISEAYASSIKELDGVSLGYAELTKAARLERDRRERFLRDRINSVAYKINNTPMTQEQKRVFQRTELVDWSNSVLALVCDQTDALVLLCEFERYEKLSGGQIGSKLQQTALRMSTSASPECRRFGQTVESFYDNPNVKVYLSEALINRLLPIRDPEFGVVQERMLNNPVVGRRRVDTTVSIKLLPDSSRLLMSLDVQGRIVAKTSSEVTSARFHNENYATYIGRKTLEWRDNGVAYSPTNISANAINRLDSVETEVDFVPLIGDMAREVARSQFEARRDEISEQTRQRVASEAKRRIDQEADSRFDEVNRRLRAKFFTDLSDLGLALKTQRSKTTDDWLLASLKLTSDASLGSQSSEPPTLTGAFADIKLHESSVNTFLARLDLAGREMNPEQVLNYLAVKLKKPKLSDIELEESKLSFTFAETDPIVARFYEDRAEINLAFSELALGDNVWEDVEVAVAYRPSINDDGMPTFLRDGNIELIGGPTSFREQIPLRAVFTKIFPSQRSFDLCPKIFQTDERFAGLKLGLCRVSKGWFAISVVKDDRYGTMN